MGVPIENVVNGPLQFFFLRSETRENGCITYTGYKAAINTVVLRTVREDTSSQKRILTSIMEDVFVGRVVNRERFVEHLDDAGVR